MLAKLAVLTMTLFSSMTYGQVPETFTVRDQVYTRGNLLRETRIELVNGEVLYKEKGTHEKSMVVPDTGGKPVILVVSGTGKTTDGREFDAHYLTDSKDELLVLEFLGHVGRSPKGDQFIGLPRAYSAGHSYASLGWTLPDRTLKIRQVNNQYMNFEKFVAYYLASGSFTVGVYEAVTGKRLTVEMVDAHAFNDPTIEISKGPTGGFPISSTTDDQLQRFASIAAGVSKIAADGVTLLLVRTEVPEAGTVTYQVDGGGTILPLTGDPFTASEASSLRVRSKPVTLLNGIHNYAFALYRAPPMVIKSRTSNFSINASFKSNVESTQSISGDVSGTLVRPPVVLVHGTYDNPKECWQTKDPDDAPQTMYQRLTDAGFRVFCVDWEKTNGREDPSDFATNTLTVLNNKDGILDALAAYRRDGIAVTQVDIVAHSQGGVITRVFARGSNDSLIDANHRHIKDKQACRASACWYHTKRNFGQGDIRRFITISSTHMGSDIPGLFRGITAVRDKSPADGATAKIFTNVVDALQYWMTGVKTGGFKDQMPGSAALNRIGPTPIKSHAIAVVCSDQIMETRKSGFYVGRLKKLWTAIPRFAIEPVFSAIGNTPGGEKMFAAAKNYADLGITDDTAVPYRDLLREFRKTVFWGEENDCVVSFSSSCGGLKGKYITKIDGYVHSFGPRETEVQVRVLELLSGPEDPFDPNGFPDSYDGKTLKTRGASDTGAGKGTKPVADNPIKPELPKTDINLKGALPPAAQDALKKAQELISQNKLADAEYLISKAVDANPKVAALWAAKSTLLVSLRRLDGAIRASQQSVELEPQNAEYRANLGMAHFANSDHQKAVDAYREAIQLAPSNGYYHGALGAGLIGLMKYKDAELPLKEAIKLTSSYSLHHLYMGDCLSFQNRWSEALPFYQEGVRLDPNQAMGFSGLGGVAFSTGRFADAENFYREAIVLQPYVATYQAHLAGALFRSGKRIEALQYANAALKLSLKVHWVFKELGLQPE